MRQIYRNTILPRLIFIPFFVARLTLDILNILTYRKFKQSNRKSTSLCLESGIKGWELIEYKEILSSAIEYLGSDSVNKVTINRELPYFQQVASAVRQFKPTHYVYDARTGDQDWLKGLIQAFRISILFQLHGVVPICTLTDLPVRSWRAQAAVVSAKRGVVVSLMSPKDIDSIFPHQRLVGPVTMPFSTKTLSYIDTLVVDKKQFSTGNSLIFTGSLYEPRTAILNEICLGLANRGITLEMKGRELGSKKFSDEEYWSRLVNATMVITTANQISSDKTDWAWLPHLIYRYLEVPAAGAVLIAQEVPSLRRFFVPDIHYISYKNPNDAIKKIEYYWDKPEEITRIAREGNKKARSIIESNFYWISVDVGLRNYPLL